MKEPVKARYRVVVPNVWTSRGLLLEGDVLPEGIDDAEIVLLKGKISVDK